MEPLHFEGYCYVLLRGNWIHPIAHRRFEFLWYPETAMTLSDQYMYRPYVQSIVTENPYLISLYDRERVLCVDENGEWRRPDHQTYAAEAQHLARFLLHLPSGVSAIPLDDGERFKKVLEDYKKRIDRAAKLYKMGA